MGDSQRVVRILGAGLAGSEAALQLADRGIRVELVEMRPEVGTAVHKTGNAAELVCSNSLKSTNPDSAAGMLKAELSALGSHLIDIAMCNRVAAGGALAVDRDAFSGEVTARLCAHPLVEISRRRARNIDEESVGVDALIVATGPLTEGDLAQSLCEATGADNLAFFDAAAPVVMAESLDREKLFSQSRYEEGAGDYLNAPFSKEEYEAFAQELIGAERVIKREFESKDLFQACQPIEETARTGIDAPRFGALKPVGLTDRNTFINAPSLLDSNLRFRPEIEARWSVPVHVAGQRAGTEGYCEAIRSGLHAALAVAAELSGEKPFPLPEDTAFGALMGYATGPQTTGYQPMHVNFGIMRPLDERIRNKRERYAAYARRGAEALAGYCCQLRQRGLLPAEKGGER